MNVEDVVRSRGLTIRADVLDEIERARRVRERSERWRLAQLRGYRHAVHHIDGDPRNNDPGNLRVVALREGGR